MAKTIVERLREERRARHGSEAPGPQGASGRARPEAVLIESFLTRFTAEILPAVTRALSQEIQGALTPIYSELRSCIHDSVAASTAELNEGIASLKESSTRSGEPQFDPGFDSDAIAKEVSEFVQRVTADQLDESLEENPFDAGAETDLEIPIAELKDELERFMAQADELPGAGDGLGDNDSEPSGEQETMMLDRHPDILEIERQSADNEAEWALDEDGILSGDDLDELDALDAQALEAAAGPGEHGTEVIQRSAAETELAEKVDDSVEAAAGGEIFDADLDELDQLAAEIDAEVVAETEAPSDPGTEIEAALSALDEPEELAEAVTEVVSAVVPADSASADDARPETEDDPEDTAPDAAEPIAGGDTSVADAVEAEASRTDDAEQSDAGEAAPVDNGDNAGDAGGETDDDPEASDGVVDAVETEDDAAAAVEPSDPADVEATPPASGPEELVRAVEALNARFDAVLGAIEANQASLIDRIDHIEVLVSANFETLAARLEGSVSDATQQQPQSTTEG